MPALQVREFPDDLYERLKHYAASQHRSIAQQTIVAVEQMLASGESGCGDGQMPQCTERRPRYLTFDTEAQRAARIKKRKELFEEIRKLPKVDVPADFPDAVELIRQGREERDAYIEATITCETRTVAEA